MVSDPEVPRVLGLGTSGRLLSVKIDEGRRGAMKNLGTWRTVNVGFIPMMRTDNTRHFSVGTRLFQIERRRKTIAVIGLDRCRTVRFRKPALRCGATMQKHPHLNPHY